MADPNRAIALGEHEAVSGSRLLVSCVQECPLRCRRRLDRRCASAENAIAGTLLSWFGGAFAFTADVRVMVILCAFAVAGCSVAAERALPTPSIVTVSAQRAVSTTVPTVAARPAPAGSSALPLPTVTPPTPPSASVATATIAASVAVPARILPGGEIPLDLRDGPVPATESEPVNGGASALGGRDVAVAWVMERYTARFDESAAARSARLAGLTSSPELASDEPPAPAQLAGGATWPINVTVSDGAAGEWHVTFTLNRTPADGPLVTMTTTVTVTGELVTGEQVQP